MKREPGDPPIPDPMRIRAAICRAKRLLQYSGAGVGIGETTAVSRLRQLRERVDGTAADLRSQAEGRIWGTWITPPKVKR